MIRKALEKHIPLILDIYDSAHEFMKNNDNPNQWPIGYPGLEDIKIDMDNDALYVLEDDNKLIGVFAFYIGVDPNYANVEGGKWEYDLPYGFIHRIASIPNHVHFADQAINYCKKMVDCLRVDTHKDNKPMQHVVTKNGFSYRGIIHLIERDQEERLAYEWSRYQKIYIAGGCFWGVEHYYSLLKGIIATKVGYANGDIANPSYEQVKHHEASHAETVEVIYDPRVISLNKILEHFLRFVDPYSIDKQGEDSGHQYRSGIYYQNEDDRKVIESYLDEHLAKPYQIEIKKLENFYDAETYHQKYLYKNPRGYCHINMHLIHDNEKQ